MSDEDDEYDDLPSISVNSSTRESSVLSMPPAAELASQRAREEETERELLRLRSRHELDDPCALRRAYSDSSSSEGEASLAAAVTALRVQAGSAGLPGARSGPDAAEILEPLLLRLPQPDDFLAEYLHAIKDADSDAASQLSEHVLSSITSALLQEEWAGGGGGEGAVSVAVWLCAASVWSAPRVSRARARRALHRLLDAGEGLGLGEEAEGQVAGALGEAAPAALRLELGDAARSGARRGADRVADALVASVLREAGGEALAGWARLAAGARRLVVRAAGRALAAEPPASRRRLLAALDHPAAATTEPSLHAADPEHLEVLVGASKLQLLFRADK